MNKILMAIIVITLGIGAVGTYLYFNINSLVKEGIESAGESALGVSVTVDKVQISILSGSGRIQGLKVANPEGFSTSKPAISIADIEVILDLSSLTTDTIIIKNIFIDGPEIFYERQLLESNIGQLQENSEGQSDVNEESSVGSNLIISHLEVRNARIGVITPLIDKAISLRMPLLELNDLGKNEASSFKKVINEVLIALNKSLIPLITENVGLGDQIKEAGKKLGDKIKGLFN